jgi:hypothetical protein
MVMKYSTWKKITVLGAAAVLSGCGVFKQETELGGDGDNGGGGSPSVTYVQIERLARPAINEGLIITNDYLNAFNSIGPSLDLSKAAEPVVAEAAVVLGAVNAYGTGAGFPAPSVAAVAGGFLPDVMRIDTRNNLATNTWAYNSDAVIVSGTSDAAMLTGGRKIEDDVMDITLSYLIAGNPACGPSSACAIVDGVSYAGGTTCASAGTGSNPGNPGHKCLTSQSSRNGSSSFPFLASPN